MSIVEADREIDRLLAHAEFERRMGCPEYLVDATLRGKLQDTMLDLGRLEDEHGGCESALEDAKYDAKREKEHASENAERADRLQAELESDRKSHEEYIADKDRQIRELSQWCESVRISLGVGDLATADEATRAIQLLRRQTAPVPRPRIKR